MVLVIGPSRVGKTTLIRLLEERLLAKSRALMVSDPSFIPFASILAAGSDTGIIPHRTLIGMRMPPGSVTSW